MAESESTTKRAPAKSTAKSQPEPEPTPESTPESEQSNKEVIRFPVSRILAEGAAMGYDPAELAGAFYGVDENKQFSPTEIAARVEKWRNKPLGG